MKIELKQITIGELCNGYEDNGDDGVKAYGGLLDVRPPYQREFVYKDKQRDAVIYTAKQGFPLNVMYWAKREDGSFEIIDGQQRTISLAQYVCGDFAYEMKYFHNLQQDEKEKFLNYELMIYICEGTDSEKLEWFKTINIAGEKLFEQELRNAVYHGSWLADAKRHFSKNQCPAYQIASDYLTGSPIRQEYLEKALEWIADQKTRHGEKTNIESYMAKHQNDPTALALWSYFQNVISWVKSTFPVYRKKLMKGLDWGEFYNLYGNKKLDPKLLEEQIKTLIADDEVQNQKGIYEYVLSGDEKALNLRLFDDKVKQKVYEKQQGKCNLCGKDFPLDQMHADHILAWSKGGKTVEENCQMLCVLCNTRKSDKV